MYVYGLETSFALINFSQFRNSILLEIPHRLDLRTFHISGCKPHLISRFYEVELVLKSTA